jgi:peroxiredoxin
MTLALGTVAPDFSLVGVDATDDDGPRPYALSDYAGAVVVLVFYPADSSPVCTVQLNTYTTDIGRFDDLGARVLAISPQSVDEHERFAKENGGFAFPLLADTEQAVGEAYGIIGPMGFYRRAVFVIDAAGVVRYAHRSTAGLTFRPTAELVDAINAIGERS